MTSRRNHVQGSDDDEEAGLLQRNSKLGRRAEMELIQLRNMERFISKFYWLLILSFVVVGVAMVVVLVDRSFADVFMAEQLMSTVGVTTYVVLFLLLLMCHSHREMRIIILLSLCFFVGSVVGFMCALHLLGASIKITNNNKV